MAANALILVSGSTKPPVTQVRDDHEQVMLGNKMAGFSSIHLVFKRIAFIVENKSLGAELDLFS